MLTIYNNSCYSRVLLFSFNFFLCGFTADELSNCWSAGADEMFSDVEELMEDLPAVDFFDLPQQAQQQISQYHLDLSFSTLTLKVI